MGNIRRRIVGVMFLDFRRSMCYEYRCVALRRSMCRPSKIDVTMCRPSEMDVDFRRSMSRPSEMDVLTFEDR